MEWAIRNGTVITPAEVLPHTTLWGRDGIIVGLGAGAKQAASHTIDATDCLALPGFIDLHAHGGDGADTLDATPEALARMATFFARHGVTAFVATAAAQERAVLTAAVAAVAAALPHPPEGARLLGLHLEGPYLAPAWAGAQPVAHFRPADPAEYCPWLATGAVKIITLAPEVAGCAALIAEAAARGIHVSAGHTGASYAELQAAIALGLRGITHTFNAMPPLHQRQPGPVGAALSDDRLFAEVIVDNVHLHPAVVALLVRAKGPARTALITDAIRAAGLPDGEYSLGGLPVRVKGSVARTPSGALAGSTLTLDAALRNVMDTAHVAITAAATMAALTPAHMLGLAHRKGRLAPGMDADLVLLDAATLEVRLTMVEGKIVYQA